MIKKEMERFEKCRIHDFKVMFIKYLENHLEHQAKVREILFIAIKKQRRKEINVRSSKFIC